jgi:hypothetical protein
MRLSELVGGRDVRDFVRQPEILEPGRAGNVKMVNGMKIVIEARLGDLLGGEASAVGEAPFDQQDLQASLGEISTPARLTASIWLDD